MNPAVEKALAASFWSKLPRDTVEKLFAEGTFVEVPAGLTVPAEEGGKQVALVLSGLFRMFVGAKSGRQVTVAYMREGDTLGLSSALTGTCKMGVQSLSVGTAWMFTSEAMKRYALVDAQLAWGLAEESGRRTYDMVGELADNAFGTVRQRVARHLLDLVVEGPNNGTLLAPISQQELANAVGTAREVVSRVLGALRTEGLVRPSPAGLEVLDATQLYEQSQIMD